MLSFVVLLSLLDIFHAFLLLGGTLVGFSVGATQGFWSAIQGLVLGFLAGHLAGLLSHLGDGIVWASYWAPRTRRDTVRRDRILGAYQQRIEAQRQEDARNHAGE